MYSEVLKSLTGLQRAAQRLFARRGIMIGPIVVVAMWAVVLLGAVTLPPPEGTMATAATGSGASFGSTLWQLVDGKILGIRWNSFLAVCFASAVILYLNLQSRRRQKSLEIAKAELIDSQKSLIAKSRELELTLEHVSNGIIMVGEDRSILVINRRAAELYDLPGDFLASHPTFDDLFAYLVQNGDFIDEAQANIDAVPAHCLAKDKSALINVYERRRANGMILEVRTEPLPGGGFVRTLTDVTERRETERKVIELANRDTLTGLANRRHFSDAMSRLSDAKRQRHSYAILFLDLDRFKAVNDTLGHAIGDLLLKEVAQRLRGALRAGDEIGRIGGDEFAVLLAPAVAADAEAVARKLTRVVAAPYEIEGHDIIIGTSVGIALAPQHGTDPSELLKAADLALYAAKAVGRGGYRVYETGMEATAKTRRSLELDLRNALANEEFEIHYQPVIDLQRETLSGFEALLRWRHPERGLVSPDSFIPIAEDLGLIVPIGAFVLDQACREAMRWPKSLKIAVNLSAAQFARGAVERCVASALAESGLEPQRLELEVTERALMDEHHASIAALERLQKTGCRISLDDFGTGYSSLSYLTRFAFDTIKIDRSFVTNLETSTHSDAIVRASISIARHLKMDLTAEGVETQQQAALLASLGCTKAQGYFYSPPVPAQRVGAIIARFGLRRAVAA